MQGTIQVLNFTFYLLGTIIAVTATITWFTTTVVYTIHIQITQPHRTNSIIIHSSQAFSQMTGATIAVYTHCVYWKKVTQCNEYSTMDEFSSTYKNKSSSVDINLCLNGLILPEDNSETQAMTDCDGIVKSLLTKYWRKHRAKCCRENVKLVWTGMRNVRRAVGETGVLWSWIEETG